MKTNKAVRNRFVTYSYLFRYASNINPFPGTERLFIIVTSSIITVLITSTLQHTIRDEDGPLSCIKSVTPDASLYTIVVISGWSKKRGIYWKELRNKLNLNVPHDLISLQTSRFLHFDITRRYISHFQQTLTEVRN